MPIGQPASKAHELYNKLIRTPYSASAEIGAIEWQLRRLRKQRPHDPETAVALLQSLVMQGKAEEAHDVAALAWGLRNKLQGGPRLTFMAQLAGLGLFDRVIDLGPDRLTDWGASTDLLGLLIQAALGQGDLSLAHRALEINEWPLLQKLVGFEDALKKADLARFFRGHQGTVAEAMRDRFTDYFAGLIATEEGVELAVRIYVHAEFQQRRSLEQRIDTALQHYYEEAGVDPHAHTPLITTNVVDIAAQAPSTTEAA